MARKNRKIDDLQGSSDHLYYEVSMFKAMANTLALGIAGDSPVGYALLESFLIHFRNLFDFFYSEKPKSDDVIAEDFFDNTGQWRKICAAQSDFLENAKKRANKELSHLTYARLNVTPENKKWPYLQIVKELNVTIDFFLQNVAKEKLGSRWKQPSQALNSGHQNQKI